MMDYSAHDLAAFGAQAVGPAGFDMAANITKGQLQPDGRLLVHHDLDQGTQQRAIARATGQPQQGIAAVEKASFSGTGAVMKSNAKVGTRAAGKLGPFQRVIDRVNSRAPLRQTLAPQPLKSGLPNGVKSARQAELENQPKQMTQIRDIGQMSPAQQEQALLEALRNGRPPPPGLTIASPMQVARKLGHGIGQLGHGLRHAFDKWGAALLPGSSPEHILHLRRK